MSDLRKRGPEGTLQSRAWALMRTQSVTAALAAELLGCEMETARKAIHYLIDRRAAAKHRLPGRQATFYSARGTKAPEDRRGKPKACRNHRGAAAYAKWVVIMSKRHGPAWRPPVKPGTELEACWPMARAA